MKEHDRGRARGIIRTAKVHDRSPGSLCDDRTRAALTAAMEVLDAATYPSMAHRPGAHRLWPTADPQPAAFPRGAGVAGCDLSAVSGLDPL